MGKRTTQRAQPAFSADGWRNIAGELFTSASALEVLHDKVNEPVIEVLRDKVLHDKGERSTDMKPTPMRAMQTMN